ncbi:piggyBac transposable element-derived protein 4-like [Haliotis rubra]|uniref:piggyBac transposable element-derived protein 4-like n=1 Tax=Haliotis rubra TaxID=36100 RepID=UPI001EE5F81A|nr:piggyBac transposable element-derived protein 4-like [Haliotis rubra]
MAASHESDSDEFSDNDFIDDVGGFDLVELNADAELEFRELFGDSDDDDDDFAGFMEYFPPDFSMWVWKKDYDGGRDRKEFVSETGPVRVDLPEDRRNSIGFFQLFYSDDVFEQITSATNDNANNKRTRDPDNNKGEWHDVTVEEMKAFYGVLLYMDVVRLDRDEMYWHSGSSYTWLKFPISEVFCRTRFVQIKRYLHFNDDTPVPGDKLFKVRYILDTMRTAFQSHYRLHKQVSVDEAMVPFKGRLSIKQYMKDKPTKFGVKVWVLADSVTGYCWNFDVYAGKYGTEIDRKLGLAGQVVIKLCENIMNKGHVIFTDNFYTSGTLGDYLLQKDTYLCGTARTNRKGYPTVDLPSGKAANRLQRGTIDWRLVGTSLQRCGKTTSLFSTSARHTLPRKAV